MKDIQHLFAFSNKTNERALTTALLRCAGVSSLPAHYLLTTCSPAPGGDDRNLHVDLCLDSFGKHLRNLGKDWMEKRKMMRAGVEWQCSGREACMGSLRS